VVDLGFEEACGGHTLARHVGKTDKWLRDRLAQGPVPHAVSSFVSYEEAVTAVDAVIAASTAAIDDWLLQDTDPRLILLYRVNPPVGRLLQRHTADVIAAPRVCVV
jgi:hypothetical protein